MMDPSPEVVMESWKRQIDYLLTLDPHALGQLVVDVLCVAEARTGTPGISILEALLEKGPAVLAPPTVVDLIRERIRQRGL